MKLLRVGDLGSEIVAALDGNNVIRDLSDHIKDLNPQTINEETLNKLKKLKLSEKTTVLICYGDSLLNGNKEKTIKIFRKFYKKKLDHLFEIIHFLPFYPSSSDSGFAVKDHYKIDSKLGSWADINKFSKKNNIMADIVINHASSKGLWFKNFLKDKSPGKDYFLKVNNFYHF